MLTNLRLALRQLAKSRGFATIAITTLAIGIGAATAMFSTLRALVVSPFNYPQADQIVQVWSGDGWPLSPADFIDLRDQSTSFTDFGVYSPQSVNIGAENAQAVAGVNTTHGVLKAFGVRPQLGRWLEATDEAPGAPRVVVISDHLWKETFGADPALIGRNIWVNGGNAEVIGIMPATFEFAGPWMRTQDCQVWLPFNLEESKDKRDSHWLCGLARLKDGVDVGTADAEIKTIGKHLAELYPDSNTRKLFLVRTLYFEMTHEIGSQVWMLFGAVIMVLLVACANVASMLLARSAQRQGEFAVRVALGASRRDLLSLALAESLALALAGAIGGLVVAYGGIEILRAISPASEARKAAMVIDGTVLAFGCGATLLTALLAGIPPALASVRTSIAGVIRSDARGSVGSRSRHVMLRSLIVTQIAVAFVLANGAALFSASYFKILSQNKNLSSEEVLSAKVSLFGERYEKDEQQVQFWTSLVDRLETLPGVTSVGLTSKLPLEGGSNTNALVNDEVYDPTQRRISVERSSITSNYFTAMGLTLLQGRNLLPEDDSTEDGLQGVVVNRAFVQKAWPDKDPIGQVIRGNNPGKPWYTATVVGVVEDVRQWGVSAEVQPEMYTTPKSHWGNRVHILLRASQPAGFLAPLLRNELAQIDSELALESIRTMQQVVLDSAEGERALAGLVNTFMAVALGLVAIGLYGTLSYHILQRTREIGVRMAVGALKGDIIRLVFGQGCRWVAIGVALGIGGAFALSSLLQNVVYGMEGLTPQPLVLATTAVGVAATIACWLPARRAAKLDPLTALRGE